MLELWGIFVVLIPSRGVCRVVNISGSGYKYIVSIHILKLELQ